MHIITKNWWLLLGEKTWHNTKTRYLCYNKCTSFLRRSHGSLHVPRKIIEKLPTSKKLYQSTNAGGKRGMVNDNEGE